MVAETILIILLGVGTLLGTVFFNIRNIRRCRACGCSCEQEIQQDHKPREEQTNQQQQQPSNTMEMVQQNMTSARQYARPTAVWSDLQVPQPKRNNSHKSLPPLRLEEPDDL